jgi:hypothetical protein
MLAYQLLEPCKYVMTQTELKWANQLFWMVKGHLVPDAWAETDIQQMEQSYFNRLWGNHEAGYHLEGFEQAWSKKYGEHSNSQSQ